MGAVREMVWGCFRIWFGGALGHGKGVVREMVWGVVRGLVWRWFGKGVGGVRAMVWRWFGKCFGDCTTRANSRPASCKLHPSAYLPAGIEGASANA